MAISLVVPFLVSNGFIVRSITKKYTQTKLQRSLRRYIAGGSDASGEVASLDFFFGFTKRVKTSTKIKE